MIEVSAENVYEGRRLASVTSTACKRRPSIISHRDVNLARRTERTGVEARPEGTAEGEMEIAKMCSLGPSELGNVILSNALIDDTEVDHWKI